MKKTLKSVLAVVLACIMLATTSIVAFADNINTPQTAYQIGLNSPAYQLFRYGTIRDDYVYDSAAYYRFTPTASDYYEISVTGYENTPYQAGHSAEAWLYIVDSNNQYVGSTYTNEVTNATKTAVYLNAYQTYYIEVSTDLYYTMDHLMKEYAEQTLALTVTQHAHNFTVSKYTYFDGSYDTSYTCLFCDYYTSVYTPAPNSNESSYEYTSSATGSTIKKASKTSITKVTPAKKAFTVKWKKPSNASGYQIQYATNKKMTSGKKTVTIKKSSTTSKKITGLKAKKKYYVRVRTYVTVNGKKSYSAWSAVKSVKTK